jgi:hypothetical protein
LLVRPAVEDEFAFFPGKGAQLQPSRFAPEECVVLDNLDRSFVRDGCGPGHKRLDARDACFDFNVSSHVDLYVGIFVL